MAPQTAGRAFNYPFGVNLSYIPRGEASITFEQLRALADNLPMLRIVIEKRKDQIKGWEWDIQPVLAGKDKRRSGQAVASDPRVDSVRDFLRRPDRRLSFHTWLGKIVEDMLVVDAACVYPRMTNGGDLFSLDVVDGSTIKVLIGEDGRVPLPEEGPAYQQILHGVPASDFSLDELLYLPRNLRSNRLYGFSPVEQIILTINIALRREFMSLAYYDAGTIPDGFGTLPATWTVDQIKSFQDWFDALMSGNLTKRRALKFMPDGFKYTEVRQPPLKDMYDEWLWRIICAAFGVSPSGVVADVNRATAQTLQVQASHEGIGPLKAWVKEFFDDVVQRLMGFRDLEFRWQGEHDVDPLEQAQSLQILTSAGIKTVDEARVELGLGPMTAADKAALEAKNVPPAPAPGQSGPVAAKPNGEVGKAADTPFRPLAALSLDRATLHQPRAAMEAAWKAILARHAQAARDAITATLSEVAKADDPAPEDETERSGWDGERIAAEVERVMERLELELSETVMREVASPMAQVARDAGLRAVAQALNVGVLLGDDPNAGAEPGREIVGGDIFDKVNTRAAAWAQEHAGELVSGVNDVTRDAVRAAVGEGLAAGERYTDIIARVESLKAFSDDRAALIAETEIANANSNGALKGLFQARDAGVNVKKAWLVAFERVCPICLANQAAGMIELEAPFPSGDIAPTAHPRCRCALIPHVQDDAAAKARRHASTFEKAFNPRQARAPDGKWTSGLVTFTNKPTRHVHHEHDDDELLPVHDDDEVETDHGTVRYHAHYRDDGTVLVSNVKLTPHKSENEDEEEDEGETGSHPAHILDDDDDLKHVFRQIATRERETLKGRKEDAARADEWDAMTPDERAAEAASEEAKLKAADDDHTRAVHLAVDAELSNGWKPKFNDNGFVHTSSTPDSLKPFASPNSRRKISARLKERGFAP